MIKTHFLLREVLTITASPCSTQNCGPANWAVVAFASIFHSFFEFFHCSKLTKSKNLFRLSSLKTLCSCCCWDWLTLVPSWGQQQDPAQLLVTLLWLRQNQQLYPGHSLHPLVSCACSWCSRCCWSWSNIWLLRLCGWWLVAGNELPEEVSADAWQALTCWYNICFHLGVVMAMRDLERGLCIPSTKLCWLLACQGEFTAKQTCRK